MFTGSGLETSCTGPLCACVCVCVCLRARPAGRAGLDFDFGGMQQP